MNATKSFIISDCASEQEAIFDVFGSTVSGTGGAPNIRMPKIGSPHPLFSDIMFCHSYDLTQLPGEHNKW